LRHFIVGLIAALSLAASPAMAAGDPYAPASFEGVKHPSWSRQAVIYQINTRQFTAAGTLRAAQGELPRLKALGVDILWLMPIQPIGVKNRKGTLGSPYSIRDYRAVNPELGTMADLKGFVAAAHAQGMHVVLDWVANHTSWDNALVAQHPDWYEHDWQGKMHPTPWWDWSDIVDLNYEKAGLRRYMEESMLMFVRQAGIDGFRCDVAGYVPPDFWAKLRRDASAIKPVWMLAEWGQRDLHMNAFDASYGWDWAKPLMAIGQGKGDVSGLFGYFSENESAWPTGAQRMVFTSNHDENSWSGTEFERYGPALPNATVLQFTGEGIPLIYNGQEAANDRRLKFFEKDPIVWKEAPQAAEYRRLIAFRDAHPALWNAPWGARMVPVVNSAPGKLFSFVRAKGGDAVMVVQNYSSAAVTATMSAVPYPGAWREEGGAVMALDKGASLTVAAWSSRVFTRRFQSVE
jgi:1,4-alpha-glucan branching enzyme